MCVRDMYSVRTLYSGQLNSIDSMQLNRSIPASVPPALLKSAGGTALLKSAGGTEAGMLRFNCIESILFNHFLIRVGLASKPMFLSKGQASQFC